MYAASDRKYALLVVKASDPLNSRVDCDTLGRMVCRHFRYQLGNPHDYDELGDFPRDLYSRSIHDQRGHLVSYLKSHQTRTYIRNIAAAFTNGLCTFAADGNPF